MGTLIIICVLLLALGAWGLTPMVARADGPDKSGVKPQVINLPSGPGSVQGLGDAFQPQLNTGTAGYRVPLSLPAGSGGFAPALSLVYDGGQGNGPFGLGWRLDLPIHPAPDRQGTAALQSSDPSSTAARNWCRWPTARTACAAEAAFTRFRLAG